MSSKPSSCIKPPIVTLATCVTMIRLLMVPWVVRALRMQTWGLALLLCAVAALSDILDGSLARLRNEQTILGACLDPLADKLLVISCFAAIASLERVPDGVPQWFVWLLICKEIILVGAISMLSLRSGTLAISPTLIGKSTTVLQMFFALSLIASYFFGFSLGYWYSLLLFVTSGMTVVSLFHYGLIWYRQSSKGRLVA